ncbi:hypothetical protein B296_00031623 [Ensete ventricosum]|uniref:Uncharacterized protein n=1 Tax=Ensete ventricosum TaxID=4639 RepID=A0A427AB27_ENSVE|nr:hypothetical protein B296_00031623 [Ensete ventricosum]
MSHFYTCSVYKVFEYKICAAWTGEMGAAGRCVSHLVSDALKLFLTFAFDLSYLCFSAFIRYYDLCRFLFLDKMNLF